MNLWKAVPLTDKKNIKQRFYFRLLWCSIGGALFVLISGRPSYTRPFYMVVMLLFALLVATAGALTDRSKFP